MATDQYSQICLIRSVDHVGHVRFVARRVQDREVLLLRLQCIDSFVLYEMPSDQQSLPLSQSSIATMKLEITSC